MKKKNRFLQWKSLIFAGIMAVITLFMSLFGSFSGVDHAIYDNIFQHEGKADKNIVVVMIDDKTIDALGAYDASVYRTKFTELFLAVDANGKKPYAIGFDMIFNENSSYDDTAFAESLSKMDNVVLGVNGYNRTDSNSYGLSKKLYQACGNIGAVDADVDSDNTIRKARLRGPNYDSLAYTLYVKYCEKKGVTPVAYPKNVAHYFDYSAGDDVLKTSSGYVFTSDYNAVSLIDLLNGTTSLDCLNKKIVLIGSYASALDTGLSDDKYYSPLGEMYGVSIQANIVQALLEENIYTETPKALSVSLDVLIVFVISYLMASFAFWIGGLIYLGSFIIEIGAMFITHSQRAYYFVSTPIILLFVGFVLIIAWHYYSEYQRKKEVMGTFKRYISPDVAEQLVNKENNAFELGGTKRNVACLFVDIRGFTKMSEELPPEVIVDVLNRYLDMSTRQVFRYGGMVDKFIGDCVMAIFNAPVDLEDYIFKAVSAAHAIVVEGKKICDEVLEKYNKKLEFGVGVHYGDAVIGNIGSTTRMDYTAIGDTVNTASRIEGSAGGNQVLISEDVYKVLEGRITVVEAGDRMFKNKKEPIKCYEVTNIEGYITEDEYNATHKGRR